METLTKEPEELSVPELEGKLQLLGFDDEDVAKLGHDQKKLAKACRLAQAKAEGQESNGEPPKNLLIIGECGDGKSSLVNALRDKIMGDDADTGLNANGVTKKIARYRGRPINGQEIVLLDTPGIGDRTIRPGDLIALLNDTLGNQQVDGVIVTTPCSAGRFKLGARFAQQLVEKCMVSEAGDKWLNIILCCTQMDRAEEDEIACLTNRDMGEDGKPKGLVAQFFDCDGAGPGWGLHAKVAAAPRRRFGSSDIQISELLEAIAHLPRIPIQYKKLDPHDEVASVLADVLGVDPEAFKTELVEATARLEKLQAEVQRVEEGQ